MRIIKPEYNILAINGLDLIIMETAGRTCYKSESKGNPEAFIRMAVKRGHETIIEHGSMTVRFISDRGFTHELVRHRMAVYSQESTRFCNYSGYGIELIHPPGLTQEQKNRRERHFQIVQDLYDLEISEGIKPQIARGVLPTALKTEIVMTCNFREWRLIFKQRSLGLTGPPHPQMLELMQPLHQEMKEKIPCIFGDL